MENTPPLQQAAWIMARSDEVALVTDFFGVIQYVNASFENVTGYERTEALGRSPSILKSGRHSRDFYRDLWTTLRDGREFHGILINRRRSGEIYHEEKTIRPLFDRDGSITHFLSSGRDVTGRVAAVERLAHAALHDTLTGLPNRALFLDRLRQARLRAGRTGESFALAMADLDSFKSVNDSLGHEAGDAVLRTAAERLSLSVREGDTVARLGGDEFGILLPGVADGAAAGRIVGKIVSAFAASPIDLEGGTKVGVTVSVGACLYPGDGEDEVALLRAADRAMYRAKQVGRPVLSPGGDAEAASPAMLPGRLQAGAFEADEALRLLAREVPIRRRTLRAGDALFRAGDPFRSVHLLRCGACKLVGFGPEDREMLVSLLFKGDWLGLEGIARGSYAYDAIALDTGEVWTMRYDTLLRAGMRSPAVLDLLHAAMSREITRDRDAMATRSALPADARVASFLHHLAERLALGGLRSDPMTLRVTRAEIATHLGLAHESISRAISRLAREDVIQFGRKGRREVHIPRLSALRDFVHRYSGS